MKFKIGFTAEHGDCPQPAGAASPSGPSASVRPSLVQVRFPDKNRTLAYYNDRFDLHVNDIVYVDGKLEGLRGRVTDVSYNFRIRLSDYHRVIAAADTNIHGQLWLAGSHLLCFDPSVIPYEKIALWFMPPGKEEDEFVSSYDDASFSLEDLSGMKISSGAAERGHEYYCQSRVCFICLEGTRGRAIVQGTHPYSLEFRYENGQISRLTCSCYCSDTCKHEFAAMLQLRESLKIAGECYSEQFRDSGYMAVILKDALIEYGTDFTKRGAVTLE